MLSIHSHMLSLPMSYLFQTIEISIIIHLIDQLFPLLSISKHQNVLCDTNPNFYKHHNIKHVDNYSRYKLYFCSRVISMFKNQHAKKVSKTIKLWMWLKNQVKITQIIETFVHKGEQIIYQIEQKTLNPRLY